MAQLAKLLDKGDMVIDGGNSRFTDDFENEKLLKAKGIGYLDCGVSGGIWGLENGYGLMVGGTAANVRKAMPIFDALRPEGPRDEGFVHAGKVGAGHYAKMVHNGIEYGLMAAYAEGYELLEAKDIVTDVPGAFKAWTPRHRRPVLAARPAGRRAGEEPAPRGRLGLHRRLRRGALDRRGGDRQLGADAGHLGLAVLPVRLAPAGVADDAGRRGAARWFGGHQVMSVAEGEELRADGAPKHEKAVEAKVAPKEKPHQERGQGGGQGPQGRDGRAVVGHWPDVDGTGSTRKRAAR